MLRSVFAAACCLVFSGAALAQDGTEVIMVRTPENAQKFFAQSRPEKYITLSSARASGHFNLEGEIQSPEVCVSWLDGRLTHIPVHTEITDREIVRTVINWSNVTGVGWDGKTIIIKFTLNGKADWVSLVYADEEIPRRVGVAGVYLQKACDRSENLGF